MDGPAGRQDWQPFSDAAAEEAFQRAEAGRRVVVDVVVYLSELLLAPGIFGVRAMQRFACAGGRRQLACCALSAAGSTLHAATRCPAAHNTSLSPCGALTVDNPFVGRDRLAQLVCNFPCEGTGGTSAPFYVQAGHMLRHGLPIRGLQLALSTHDWAYAGFVVMNLIGLLVALLAPKLYRQPGVRNALAASTALVSTALHVPTLAHVHPSLPPMPRQLLPLSAAYLYSAAHKRQACFYVAWKYLLATRLPTSMFILVGFISYCSTVAAYVLVDQALLPADGGGAYLTYPTIAATFLLVYVVPGIVNAWREGEARSRWLLEHAHDD